MWLRDMNKTASLNSGGGQDKNVQVTAGTMFMRKKLDFSCKYCLMWRPFPPNAKPLPQSRTDTIWYGSFQMWKLFFLPSSLKLFLPSSLKFFGRDCPSGEEQELQGNPKEETKKTLSKYKVLAQKRVILLQFWKCGFLIINRHRPQCHNR